MTTMRGRVKQDLIRAKNNAARITERVLWIIDEYEEFPEFIENLQSIAVFAKTMEQFIDDVLGEMP